MSKKKSAVPIAPPLIRPEWLSFVLIASVLFVFLQVSRFNFLHFDDGTFIWNNPYVPKGLTWVNLHWAFTADLWNDSRHIDYWQPLTILSRLLDVELFGLRPGGHHLTNLWIHLLNTLLLFSILRSTTAAVWKSAAVSLLFAVHPLQTESVAWIASRKDLLSCFFGLLTLKAYIRYICTPKRSVGTYFPVLLAYVLALMSKPMLVVFPVLLLAFDYWPFRRFSTLKHFAVCAREKIPLFIPAALVALITSTRQHSYLAHVDTTFFLWSVPLGYLHFIRAFFFPFGLHFQSPSYINTTPVAFILLSAAFLILTSVWVIKKGEDKPYLVFGWFWFLIGLTPVMGLAAWHDRFMYMPIVGLAVIFVWGIAEWGASHTVRKVWGITFLSLFLVFLGLLARRQTAYWHDDITLFSHALSVNPNNYVAHAVVGNALIEEGKVAQGMHHYHRSEEIEPDFAMREMNFGDTLARLGEHKEAEDKYDKILAHSPYGEGAYAHLDKLLGEENHEEEAIRHYEKALRINPHYAFAHNNLATILAPLNRLEEAKKHLLLALEIDPRYADAHYNLAKLLVIENDTEGALLHYEKTLSIAPDYVAAENNWGNILQRQGKLEEAVTHYQKALTVDPAYRPAADNLAFVLSQMEKNRSGR